MNDSLVNVLLTGAPGCNLRSPQSIEPSFQASTIHLISASSKRRTVQDELKQISIWAQTNSLRLKTNTFRKICRRTGFELHPSITDIERVSSMKKFIVVVERYLSERLHVIITSLPFRL